MSKHGHLTFDGNDASSFLTEEIGTEYEFMATVKLKSAHRDEFGIHADFEISKLEPVSEGENEETQVSNVRAMVQRIDSLESV